MGSLTTGDDGELLSIGAAIGFSELSTEQNTADKVLGDINTKMINDFNADMKKQAKT